MKKEPEKKPNEPERTKDGLPVVSSKMTVAQLKRELLAREPEFKGHSKMKSADFLAHLGPGSVCESHPETRQARDREWKLQHNVTSLAHCHPLADSSTLRCPPHLGTKKTRAETAQCECPHRRWCRGIPYRSCEQCDFDLCRSCFELESMPEAEKTTELDRRYDKMAEENAAAQRAFEERQQAEAARRKEQERRSKEEFERKHAAELKRFARNIRDPPAKHLDADKKLKFTVWTSCGYDNDGWHSYCGPPSKEFNSSFATVEEANQRVEYVFLFQNPWGLDLDEMHSDDNFIDSKGFRRMEVAPDDSQRWTVSVVPSQAFEYLD